jgi:hypothetical protein
MKLLFFVFVVASNLLAADAMAANCIPTTVNGIPSPLIAGVGQLQLAEGGTVNGTRITYSGRTSLPITGTTSSQSAGPLPALTPSTFPSVGTRTLNTSGTVNAGSYGTITASGNPTVFTGGDYYINTLYANGPIQLAAGNYFIRNFYLNSDLTVTGPVQLFIGSRMNVADGVSINAGGNAGNLQISLYAGVDFQARSNTSFTGLLYSPFAGSEVQFASNTTITGAVIMAGELQFSTNTTINFDTTVQEQIATLTCPNSGPDHYELSLPTASLSCLSTTVTITACADASSPCANNYTGASGKTATIASSGGTLGAAMVTFNANGVASTTLSYPTAADGTSVSVTLSGVENAAANSSHCCPDGVNCVVANSCSTTFNTAGFIFAAAVNGTATTIPTQVAGTSSGTYYLRAVKTNTATMACQAALTGQQVVDFAYECINPMTCHAANLMSVNGGNMTLVQRNDAGGVASYLPVDMTFDANGNAPFTFNYSDVGLVALHASMPARGALLAPLSGSSNAYVVKPAGFVLSAIKCTTIDAVHCAAGALAMPTAGDNPAAVNATGATFIRAGDPFSVTVTAINAGGTATPNFGKESTAESVKLTTTLSSPLNGNNPALTGTFAGFQGGVASGTGFSWDEVGAIALTPGIADGDYLGAGNVTGTATSVGRFIPHHFDTAVRQGCQAGGFSYSGQPYTVEVSARNLAGGITQNYNAACGYAKDVTLSNAGSSTNLNVGWPPPATATQTMSKALFNNPAVCGAAMDPMSVANGTQTNVTYTFAAPAVPAIITMRAVDSDGVTSSVPVEGTTQIRSGRIRLTNAHGSELLPLSMPIVMQYFTNDGWVTNLSDICSVLVAGNFAFSSPGNNLAACETALTLTGSSPSYTASLSAPGNGNNGWTDLTLNLGAAPAGNACTTAQAGYSGAATTAGLPWLQFPWTGGAATNPTARATFGIYKGAGQFIYQRENY